MLKKEIYVLSFIVMILSVLLSLTNRAILIISIPLFCFGLWSIIYVTLSEIKIFNLPGKFIKLKDPDDNRIFLVIKIEPRDDKGIWRMHILCNKKIVTSHFFDYEQFLKEFEILKKDDFLNTK